MNYNWSQSQFILRGTSMSAPNFMAINPIVMETFHWKPRMSILRKNLDNINKNLFVLGMFAFLNDNFWNSTRDEINIRLQWPFSEVNVLPLSTVSYLTSSVHYLFNRITPLQCDIHIIVCLFFRRHGSEIITGCQVQQGVSISLWAVNVTMSLTTTSVTSAAHREEKDMDHWFIKDTHSHAHVRSTHVFVLHCTQTCKHPYTHRHAHSLAQTFAHE